MKHEILTQPTEEPLTVAEAKLYLRVGHSSEDTLIASQIVAARRLCEASVRMSFLTQKRRSTYRLPRFDYDIDFHLGGNFRDPDGINKRITLARGPVTAIDSIKIYHTPSTTIDLTADEDFVFHPASNTVEWEPDSWGSLMDTYDFIQVDYTAGLPNATEFQGAFPDIVEAIKVTIASMYDERGYSRQTIPPIAAQLLSAYWTSPTY